MSKIAAGIIVKDDSEAENLTRCLNTVASFVDGIFLTVTNKPYFKIKDIANRYGANLDVRVGEFFYTATAKEIKWLEKNLGYPPTIKKGDKVFQFDKARNANLDFIPDQFEWLFWIDCDDILRNGNLLHPIADEAILRGSEAVFLNYLYQVEIKREKMILNEFVNPVVVEGDKITNTIIQHLRERLVRIDGEYRKVYRWIGSIHETLIQQRETKKDEDQRADILHLTTDERRQDALIRNLKTLEIEIYKTKGQDPRPIYYLGKAFYDFHTTEDHLKAEKLMVAYLSPAGHERNMSGWREERAQAWEYLAEIYRSRSEHNNSIKCLHNSLIEYPQFPSTYFSLALSHMLKEDYDTARFWVVLGSQVPPVRTTLVSNPRDLQSRAYEVLYNTGIKTNRVDESWAAAEKLKELFPSDPVIDQQWQFINATRQIRDVTKNYIWLASYLNQTGEGNKLRPLLMAAPSTIADNPLVVKLQQDLYPPKSWEENEIAFYLGPQFTVWTPKTLEDPQQSFIGGSEEAMIYLAKELANLGWKVTVYADPGPQEGEYDGVNWFPYYRFNIKDKFNVLVVWRQIGFFTQNIEAKKIYLWLHDVANPVEFTQDRLDKITKIFVLSPAHRTNIPDVPDEKVMVSTNGYFEHFPELQPENNPHWCIWTSSYDRGLEHLLNIWPDVKKEVPDAELHVFYGWKLFQTFYAGNPERMAWMQKMNKLMEQPGITHHDRVSQPEMEKWYKKCGIWSYSTHFFEINCISAIKAQLWGCVPVCMGLAALETTVQHGKKIKGDIWEPEVKEEYKKSLIEALKTPQWQEEQRKLMMPWARENFTWKKVASQWLEEFKK